MGFRLLLKTGEPPPDPPSPRGIRLFGPAPDWQFFLGNILECPLFLGSLYGPLDHGLVDIGPPPPPLPPEGKTWWVSIGIITCHLTEALDRHLDPILGAGVPSRGGAPPGGRARPVPPLQGPHHARRPDDPSVALSVFAMRIVINHINKY